MTSSELKGGMNLERPWSVLHVIANHEKQVARHLAVHSFEYYLPLYTKQSRRADCAIQLNLPLFAGYVFVRYEPRTRIALLSIPSVLHLLGDDKQNLVDAVEINRIRDGLANGCVLQPHAGVVIGTRVRVNKGIFEGVEGIVTKFCKSCKVVMMLEAMQQNFSVEVDLTDIDILHETV